MLPKPIQRLKYVNGVYIFNLSQNLEAAMISHAFSLLNFKLRRDRLRCILSLQSQNLSKICSDFVQFTKAITDGYTCPICITEKSKKAPIYSTTDRDHTVSIHMDISAPISPASLGRSSSVLQMIETSSHHFDLFTIPSKGAQNNYVKYFITKIYNHYLCEGLTSTSWQADDTRKNVFQGTVEYCHFIGLSLITIPAYLAPSNGIAKRLFQKHWT